MRFPTNAAMTIIRSVETGRQDGTPIYEDQRLGPYRAWWRDLTPDEAATEVKRESVAYLQGFRPGLSDRAEVTVDGAEAITWEVLDVRDRTDGRGIHHHQVRLQRVIEGT